ncbi:MAG TPA: histidine kinase [Clostridiaceae bacterium]|nr:histidine kinase [Clostridiaceae bacterium]
MRLHIWEIVPLKKRIIMGFSIVIILIGLLSGILYYNMLKTFHKVDDAYLNFNILKNYYYKIEKVSVALNGYLNENDRSYISAFYQEYDQLLDEMNNTQLLFVNRDTAMLFKNIKHMFESYGEEAEAAINEYRKRNLSGLSSSFSRTLKIKSYMQEGIYELMINFISQSEIFQKNLYSQLIVLRTFIVLLIIISIVLNVLIAVYLNRLLIQPINILTKLANEIFHGEFEFKKIEFSLHGELKILSDTLYRIGDQIKEYVEEIRKKAEIEKQLQIKEKENYKIKALLQEAELKRLQAQINPHFLFNTLSTLHHTAFLECANETCEMVSAISKILRYNLRNSNAVSVLKDEIENIKYYFYIQEKRFGHRVKIHFEIDEDLLDTPIPSMTIQPIVENSFIHGLEKNENQGEISLKVYKEANTVIIEVRDNGVGIKEDRLNHIKKAIECDSEYSGHTSNLGINNVVKRLQAFYNTKNVFSIESVPYKETIIKLFLPYKFQYKNNETSLEFVL